MGVLCSKKINHDVTEIDIQSGSIPNRFNGSAEKREQESNFNKMIAGVVINFPWIKEERDTMGPYKFPTDYSWESLTLVPNMKTLRGTYYGFISGDTGKPEYKGLMISDDGCVYEGEFDNGEIREGRKFTEGKSVYVGELRNQLPHGKGKTRDKSGNVFEGQWINGKQNGPGLEQTIDGSFYEGLYVDGEWDGQGTLKTCNNSQYKGSFKKGVVEGYGTLIAEDGSTISGTWKAGKLSGDGSIKEKCGKEYIGRFVKGKREGEGTEYFNGVIKRGLWKKDKFIEENKKNDA